MKESIIIGIVGLVLGSVITGTVMSQVKDTKVATTTQTPTVVPTQISEQDESMSMMDHSQLSMDQMSMGDMMMELQDKKGDDFDRTFIQAMISHHQGAIDMANMAKQNAKHQEIKDLSDDIISAQTKEIETMQIWQKKWGY
jgi:uncharacterized protein (DUF305 family)